MRVIRHLRDRDMAIVMTLVTQARGVMFHDLHVTKCI